MQILIRSLICSLLLITNIDAGIIDPNVPDQKYIDYASQYDCVAKITAIYKDKKFGEASCVIINPHWVITSAHIVDKAQLCMVKVGDTHYHLPKIIIHIAFDRLKTKSDLALCYSPTEIKLDKYPELYREKDEVGKVCSIVGYGLTGNFNTGVKISDSKKRAGKNVIDSVVDEDLLLFKITKENKTGLDIAITRGDSGGGMFIDGKLAGINCCVLARDRKPDSDYDDECCFMRISNYYNWINTNVNNFPGSE